jgi:protoheme IX farnesyltransferase
MERTRGRPIPSGRLSSEVALLFSLALAVMGFAVLARWANALTCLLAVGAFLIYALVYTPAKRLSPYALHLGAVPGAIPPLIGWVSMTGNLSLAGWSLFAILFVWQLPHFMAIALFRAADYQRAGFRVYPGAKGIAATQRAMIFWSLVLAATTLLPWWAGLAGPLYAAVAVLLGAAFCGWVIAGPRKLGLERWARSVFAASIPYLVLVFGALAFGAQ